MLTTGTWFVRIVFNTVCTLVSSLTDGFIVNFEENKYKSFLSRPEDWREMSY